MIATCAACEATIEVPSSDEVYGVGSFEPAEPVVDRRGTGWIAWNDRRWCPAHADAPARYAEAERRWDRARAEADAAWVAANPHPSVADLEWPADVQR